MNLKTSKTTTSGKDFYFSIFDFIKYNEKLPSHLGTKQKINYYVKKLITFGAIRKIGYGTWAVNETKFNEATSKNFKQTTSKVTNSQINKTTSKLTRGHNFQFKLNLPNIPNWEKKELFLTAHHINYSKKYNKGEYVCIEVNKNKVWLCNKSIVVYFNPNQSYIGHSAVECRELAEQDFFKIITHLESVFSINLRINKKYDYKIVRNHYAQIDNELAKDVILNKQKLSIKGDDGKEWVLADFSNKQFELEAVHSQRAESDYTNVVAPLMNTLRSEPTLLSNLKEGQLIHEKELADIRDVLKEVSEKLYASAFIQKDFMQNVAIRIKALEHKLYK